MKRNHQTFPEVLQALISEFVIHPEDVAVNITTDDPIVKVRLACHAGDRGKLIGRGGAHFKAIADICNVWADRHNFIIEVKKIEAQQQGVPEPYGRFTPRTVWPKDRIVGLVEQLCRLVLRDDTSIQLDVFDKTDESEIRVHTSEEEPLRSIDRISRSLGVIVRAAGNRHGRMLSLRFVQDQPKSRQPISL
jgi:predicted RNA-binding protein YlqC (UPF0109 family)